MKQGQIAMPIQTFTPEITIRTAFHRNSPCGRTCASKCARHRYAHLLMRSVDACVIYMVIQFVFERVRARTLKSCKCFHERRHTQMMARPWPTGGKRNKRQEEKTRTPERSV